MEWEVEGKTLILQQGGQLWAVFFMKDAVMPHINVNQQLHLRIGAVAELKICTCRPSSHMARKDQTCPNLAAWR